MGVKTITITLKAYQALLKHKKEGESFSDVIIRLTKTCGDLLDLAGAWSDVTPEEAEKTLLEIREAWRKWGKHS